jgi:hypothetical protein
MARGEGFSVVVGGGGVGVGFGDGEAEDVEAVGEGTLGFVPPEEPEFVVGWVGCCYFSGEMDVSRDLEDGRGPSLR